MGNDRFTDALLEEIKAKVPITQVVGQYVTWDVPKSFPQRGDMWANCPFHSEHSPSFHADEHKGRYHCFGCGRSGDHYQFLVEQAGMTFPDAVKVVAEMAGVPLPEAAPRSARAESRSEVQRDEGPEQAHDEPAAAPSGKWTLVEADPYTDSDGNLLYEICRIQWKLPDGSWVLGKKGKPKKSFVQRRPSGCGDGSNAWGRSAGEYMRAKPGRDWKTFNQREWDEKGGERGLMLEAVVDTVFEHPALEIAISEGRTILLPEGERKVRASKALGYGATCNSGGAKNWQPHLYEIFRGADVVIPVDNDDTGREAGELKAATLQGIAARVRVLDFSRFIADFPPQHDIVDWHAAGGTAEQLDAMIAQLPDWAPAPPRSTFGAKRTTQIANAPIVYDWLIKGLVERNGTLMFAGERQSAKTFAVLDMGMKIARGLPYCGRKTRQGLVVHMACEDGKGVQMRVEGYRRKNKISADEDIPYIVMAPDEPGADRFTLMSDDSTDKFIAEVLVWRDWFKMPVEMIIIDTLSKATEGMNEIDGAEVGKVLARADRIRLKTGATVTLVHHMNASGNRMRGHGSLGDNVPNVIEIRPLMTVPKTKQETAAPRVDGDGRVIRQLTLAKNKNGLNNVKWNMVLEIVDLGEDSEGDRVTTCVCAPPTKSDRSDADEVQTLSPDQKLVFDALKAAMEDGKLPMPQGVRVGPQIKECAPASTFTAYVRRQMTFTSSEDDKAARDKELSAFLKRTTTSLINGGYMGRDGDHKIVWWTGKSDRPTPRHRAPEPPPYEPPGSGISDEVRREVASLDTPF